MNKKVIIVSMVVLLLTSVLLFSAGKKQEMWRKAITEKDPELRLQYLKAYEVEFGKKKDKFHKYLYFNLANTAFKLGKYDEAIQYGEKDLTFEDLDDANRLQIYLFLANSYKMTKKDIEKAYHYAGLVVDMSKTLVQSHENSEQEQEKKDKYIANYRTFYMAPALRIQSQILFDKGKDDPENLKDSAAKACEAYEADKSKRSVEKVFGVAINLYRKRLNDEAIKAVEMILDEEKPQYSHTYMLGTLYNRKKDKKNATRYFEMAYKSQKKAKLALNIGKLVFKQNRDKGIRYFSEAFVLSKSSKESDAYRYLENLYFNNPEIKKQTPEEQEKGFRSIINGARSRLGMEPLAAPPTATEKTAETTESTEG